MTHEPVHTLLTILRMKQMEIDNLQLAVQNYKQLVDLHLLPLLTAPKPVTIDPAAVQAVADQMNALTAQVFNAISPTPVQ